MLSGKKAVIFDMDGTLTDSMWIWPEVDRIFLKKYHLTPPPGFAKALEGKSYTETAQYFLDVFPELSCSLENVQKEWIDMTLHLYQTQVELKPGAKGFLEFLKQEQILMGIATSNAKELALAALDALQIREYFSSVRTGCEVKKGKPAPDVYLKVAEDLGVQPEECLVFEDVPKGIEAGRNAGMTVCAVDDAFSASDEKEKKEMKDRVKANILNILSKEYGVDEEDFLSAEIEVVPAGAARDYGFDRSMIMGYGHDDRVCAYPSFAAMLEIEKPQHTSVCLLVDKEEIGSVGASGMQSHFFEDSVAEIINLLGEYSELKVRRALHNSRVLSSDVSAAFDPNYPSVMEKRNCAYFGKGLVLNKYTGARGKSGSNDANAEYIARLRRIFDDNDVSFQTSELGKVDQGGGGTIAYILANYGMNVIDSGVAVLNMHAPWEIISKVDLYEALHGYVAFLKEA